MDLPGELREQGVARRNSDGRLADTAGSNDRDKTFVRQLARYFIDGLVAAPTI